MTSFDKLWLCYQKSNNKVIRITAVIIVKLISQCESGNVLGIFIAKIF